MLLRGVQLWRVVLVLVVAGFLGTANAREVVGWVVLADLPPEAAQTLALIRQGGPFPHPRKDGSVFGNFEKRLPLQPRGYYREYTVPTPGARNRGARRIVSGGEPCCSGEYYYTGDHYRTFARIRP